MIQEYKGWPTCSPAWWSSPLPDTPGWPQTIPSPSCQTRPGYSQSRAMRQPWHSSPRPRCLWLWTGCSVKRLFNIARKIFNLHSCMISSTMVRYFLFCSYSSHSQLSSSVGGRGVLAVAPHFSVMNWLSCSIMTSTIPPTSARSEKIVVFTSIHIGPLEINNLLNINIKYKYKVIKKEISETYFSIL